MSRTRWSPIATPPSRSALERDAVKTAQLAADIARAQVEAGTVRYRHRPAGADRPCIGDLDTLAQIRLARFTALVALYKALGGGWTRADTPPPPSSIYHGIL